MFVLILSQQQLKRSRDSKGYGLVKCLVPGLKNSHYKGVDEFITRIEVRRQQHNEHLLRVLYLHHQAYLQLLSPELLTPCIICQLPDSMILCILWTVSPLASCLPHRHISTLRHGRFFIGAVWRPLITRQEFLAGASLSDLHRAGSGRDARVFQGAFL